MPDLPENIPQSAQSQVEVWTAELALLRQEPTVRKFLELQERIKWTHTSAIQADAPSLTDALGPYDLYDAFEFARDLAGKQVSAQTLSRLLFGRFPAMSKADWQVLIHFLIERGVVEIVRTTETGGPDLYVFAPPRKGGTSERQKKLGLPSSELSGLKGDDLDDIVGRPAEETM
jgi:hypothetical protein